MLMHKFVNCSQILKVDLVGTSLVVAGANIQ